jgi:O-antigen ligase
MKPLKFLTAIVIAFEIMMLLFTLSRGGVLAFIVMVPFMIIYIYHGQRSKFRVTMYLLMIMISLAVVFALRTDYFQPLFDRFKELDFAEGNGRVDLWIQAYHKFKEHPLLGAGLLARFEEGRYHFYHNTIMHTLASFGIIGLASLVWQLIEVVIMFVKKANVQKSVLFLAIMAANIHGMVDNVYYQLQFMALFFVIISVVEAYNREKEYTSRFWRLENASTYEI